MGCLKLSILDEQYKKTEIRFCSCREGLTFGFFGGNARSYTIFAPSCLRAFVLSCFRAFVLSCFRPFAPL